jgi:methionyl-tRNA formyltransferase
MLESTNTEATFASNIKREQEKIDWTKTGEEIYNHIRGLNPWPVAFTTLNGQVLKIWGAQKESGLKSEVPGTVLKVETNSFTVSTGNETAIKIIELQPSGKTKMMSDQFLRGSKISIGTKLGD